MSIQEMPDGWCFYCNAEYKGYGHEHMKQHHGQKVPQENYDSPEWIAYSAQHPMRPLIPPL